MALVVPLDSAYVGFIFLVVAELLLVPPIVLAHTRSVEREIKRRFDGGKSVRLRMRSIGPFDVNPHLGWKTAIVLVLPASFTVLLLWVAELGISGRTVDSWSNLQMFSAGSYFTLDSVSHPSSWSPAPHQIAVVWSQCVQYYKTYVAGHVAEVSYESTDAGYFTFAEPLCSPEAKVVTTDLSSECYEQHRDTLAYFDFNVTALGDVVYHDSNRTSVMNRCLGEFKVTVGNVVVGQCSRRDGGPGIILWVEAEDVEDYAIIDDSWRVGGATERWIVSSDTSPKLGNQNTGNGVVVECEFGCLEAIVEWTILMGSSVTGAGLNEATMFMSIWFEGMNWDTSRFSSSADVTVPLCPSVDGVSSNWLMQGLFTSGSCSNAVGQPSMPDGGSSNVTEGSFWAVAALACGTTLTIFSRIRAQQQGYNITSYEGLSKAYFVEVNPGCSWNKGDGLEVSLSKDHQTNVITARQPLPSFAATDSFSERFPV